MREPRYGVDHAEWKDSQGRWITRGLFFETCHDTDIITPRWTLRNEDILDEEGNPLYRSAKLIYLDVGDVTEWQQAHILTACWDHWERLQESPQLMEYIYKWRYELELKVRSEAIRSIRGSEKPADHKWLAERGWADNKKQRGRPTKKDVAAQRQRDADLAMTLDHITQGIN